MLLHRDFFDCNMNYNYNTEVLDDAFNATEDYDLTETGSE